MLFSLGSCLWGLLQASQILLLVLSPLESSWFTQVISSQYRVHMTHTGICTSPVASRRSPFYRTWTRFLLRQSSRCWVVDQFTSHFPGCWGLAFRRVWHTNIYHWILVDRESVLSSSRWSDWSLEWFWRHQGWICRILGGNCAGRDGLHTLGLLRLQLGLDLQTSCESRRNLPWSLFQRLVSTAFPCSIAPSLGLWSIWVDSSSIHCHLLPCTSWWACPLQIDLTSYNQWCGSVLDEMPDSRCSLCFA